MMLQNRRYVFLGPQGSGKGTQAKLLAEAFGIPHISTGDIFRAAVNQDAVLGQRIAAGLTSGKLIVDEDTNSLVADRLSAADAQKGFILDGYPRTMTQVEYLEKLAPPAKIILLNLSDDEAIARMRARRVCADCGSQLSSLPKSPRQLKICDNCGGNLRRRLDDSEEAIKERLKLYHRETEPLIKYYKKSGRLITIDGRPAIAKIYEDIRRALQM